MPAGLETADAQARGTDLPQVMLPLVSVVIINFNYGRFLAQAIASVFAQTYPRIECIVVDNASTDCSKEVIATSAARHPNLTILNRAANDGQSVAAVEGLNLSSGPYVVFLDADDYLLPRCIETHMRAHLSTRVHVGFTCVDMLQVVGDQVDGNQVVVSTNEPMATHIRSTSRHQLDLLRPSAAALGTLWNSHDETLAERVHLIGQTQQNWVWSPTSGNCFRRDALDLFCDNSNLKRLRSQTDLYLALGVNAITGSILIDEPLFAYRLHGTNVFSSRPQLNGILAFDPVRTFENAGIARRLIIEQVISKAERFAQEQWQSFELFKALKRLDVSDETYSGPAWGRRSYLAQMLIRHFAKACDRFGRHETVALMKQVGVPLHVRLGLAKRRNGSAETVPLL